MTRVKICGITSAADARVAVDAGADALGFIMVPGTPRFVGDRDPHELLSSVPPFVMRVAVARSPAEVPRCWAALVDAVQYYEEGPWPDWAPRRRLRVVRVRRRDDIVAGLGGPEPVSGVVLDTYHDTLMGGSGLAFDWSLAEEAVRLSTRPVILAGGLNPGNVGMAVRQVRPYAVDVSSGVESGPGRKCPVNIGAFLAAVREADAADERPAQ